MRLADVPDARGPLAGLLAAMRWAPHASWLVAACNMHNLSPDAITWLLSTRRPGAWATVPKLPASTRAQPLLAHYDFRVRALIGRQVAAANFRASTIADHPMVISPPPPADLAAAWQNVNRPEDLESFSG